MECRGDKIMDHWPNHGLPLEVLCKSFAEFSDLTHSVEPLPLDCTSAFAMVDTASEVVLALQAPWVLLYSYFAFRLCIQKLSCSVGHMWSLNSAKS